MATALSPLRGGGEDIFIPARYLRENIQYGLGESHEAALARFYSSAAHAGVVTRPQGLRFSGRDRQGVVR